MKIKEWHHVILIQISQAKLDQIVHVGGVLKTSGPADFKLTKICVSHRAKQNIQLFVPVLYIVTKSMKTITIYRFVNLR